MVFGYKQLKCVNGMLEPVPEHFSRPVVSPGLLLVDDMNEYLEFALICVVFERFNNL